MPLNNLSVKAKSTRVTNVDISVRNSYEPVLKSVEVIVNPTGINVNK